MLSAKVFSKRIEKWAKMFPESVKKTFGNVRTILVKDIQRNYLSGQVLNARTGRLRASIRGEIKMTPLTALMLGTDVFYGAIWFNRGRDFLNPSIKKNMSRIERMILDGILDDYKRVVK